MLIPVAEHPTAPAFPPWLDCWPEPTSDRATGWPLLATPVSTGFSSPVDEAVKRYLSLDAHLVRHPENTFLMRADGNDLAEAGIYDGDLLVVDRAAPPTTGSLVMAVIEGAFALRRVGRDAQGRRVLQSPHADVPDGLLSGKPDCQIWGVVRWAIHRLWPGRLAS